MHDLVTHDTPTPSVSGCNCDKSLTGIAGLNERDRHFISEVWKKMASREKLNKLSLEKLAANYGITSKNFVKELTELVIVMMARRIAAQGDLKFDFPDTPVMNKFDQILELYNNQVNLSNRTSQSIMLQQYSTPAPLGFLSGVYVTSENAGPDKLYFEPSAGNGMLTVALPVNQTWVNEIDDVRNGNLAEQEFPHITKQDATRSFDMPEKFDGVITNPPFGKLDDAKSYDGFPIKTLDHLMALRALDTMKDSGRSAIIIGGHTQWDENGRIQAGKNRIFFNYLYKHYYVDDVINVNGDLYSRQGTSFDIRLILIRGRKENPGGVAPLFNPLRDVVISNWHQLMNRVLSYCHEYFMPIENLEKTANDLLNKLSEEDLGAPYRPASESCVVLDLHTPDNMSYEIQLALIKTKKAVGGSLNHYVMEKCGYKTDAELCKALAAEQIDGVALAIYNIEEKGQGIIIGDQTGIGKGRMAAAVIRYARHQGKRPIFFTERPNLFSDLYRDMKNVGSSQLVPFIINTQESKTDVKDEDGTVIYTAPPLNDQQRVFKEMKLPSQYDYILTTYSQVNSIEKRPVKPAFIAKMAKGNVVILDESHNASGESNTGQYMQDLVSSAMGVGYFSATYAKRPDNMPLYALKTCMSEANMTKEELIEAITKGGVALQEIISAQLVAAGQMIRRERTFEGIDFNFIMLDQKAKEHVRIADSITEIIRGIIGYQKDFVKPIIEQMDKIAAAEGKEAKERKGTSKAGVDNQPYFSKVFQVINQMLFSIKADDVATEAINQMKAGKKPVIAFFNTMEAFIDDMVNESGLNVKEGDTIPADFSVVLKKGLEGIQRYTVYDEKGNAEHKTLEASQLPIQARGSYEKLMQQINSISTGITISPIDLIKQKIKAAGFTVEEVTGRQYELQLNEAGPGKSFMAVLKRRKKMNVNDAYRLFNDNEIDCLMINQSGATGASAHAIPTKKVPRDKVKPRRMINLQAELDINKMVQKLGRINRTGQVILPGYDFVSSAIPAEQRLMMMLGKKLKSLSANTTSDQHQSDSFISTTDFLNKYGDKLVKEYLMENAPLNELLDDPLHLKESKADSSKQVVIENAASKVSGRIAVLSVAEQEKFYTEITDRYNDLVDYLKQTGEYDLEVETMNLQAETLDSSVIKVGKGGETAFGDDTVLEKAMVNVLKKPYNKEQLEKLISESLEGKTAEEKQKETVDKLVLFTEEKLNQEIIEANSKYDTLILNIPEEPEIKKITNAKAKEQAILLRTNQLNDARSEKIKMTTEHSKNHLHAIRNIFDFFRIGKGCNYPIKTFEGSHMLTKAVFLGYQVNEKRPNPYAMSAIKFRLALADTNRYIAIPFSLYNEISAIKGNSYQLTNDEQEAIVNDWSNIIKESTISRKVRYIVTGNLLQAFSDWNGKLVSYTTMASETKKGILMPDNWIPAPGKDTKVVIPIMFATDIIKSMPVDQLISTNNGMAIARHSDDDFKLMVPASRSKGGEFYLNQDLLEIVENNIFEKVSDTMRATLPVLKVDRFIDIMQKTYSASISISRVHYDLIKDKIEKKQPKKEDDSVSVLELEAEALTLELELMNLSGVTNIKIGDKVRLAKDWTSATGTKIKKGTAIKVRWSGMWSSHTGRTYEAIKTFFPGKASTAIIPVEFIETKKI